MRTGARWAWITAALVLGIGGCGSSGGDDDPDVTTTVVTSTTAVDTTAAATTTSTVAPLTTTEAESVPLAAGDPCALGSHPDCIDPDQDGQGTYLLGGADCVATFADAVELCSDLDGDGTAGYPDEGEAPE